MLVDKRLTSFFIYFEVGWYSTRPIKHQEVQEKQNACYYDILPHLSVIFVHYYVKLPLVCYT